MPVMTWKKTGKDMAFKHKALNAALGKAIREFEKVAIAEHEKVTETWEHKPKFRAKRGDWTGTQRTITVHIWTDDKIWKFVDEGTKPHPIEPRRKPRLVFPSVFKPKTKPRSLSSGTGQKGGPLVYAMHVNHPGTKARNFSAMLQKKLDNVFATMLNDVFERYGPQIL